MRVPRVQEDRWLSRDARWPHLAYIQVRSLSLPAWQAIRQAHRVAYVVGYFRRSVDLLIEETDFVLALVVPKLLNGPFHIVIEELPSIPLPRRVSLRQEGMVLRVGPWTLRFPEPLVLWDPAVPWSSLYVDVGALRQVRRLVERAGRRRAPFSPFVRVLWEHREEAVAQLGKALLVGDRQALVGAVQQIAGRGPGLTPSGDDFLAGVILAMQTSARFRDVYPKLVYEAAVSRTHRLSRAFLRAAAEGQADERWHRFLRALGGEGDVEAAVRLILSFGASSGLEMLAGFLWMMDLQGGNLTGRAG